MTWDLLIESDCVPVKLRAGAHVTCRAGRLWITVEHRRARPSADIVLSAGQQCRVEEDGVYFLSALRALGVVQCHITPAAQQYLVLRPA